MSRAKITRVIILIVIVAVAGLIGRYFWDFSVVREKVSTARSNAMESADESFAARINLLKQGGVMADEIASSKIDVCYVTHADGGWFAVSWYQDCYIRYVKGFSTSLDRDAAQQKVLELPDAESNFGEKVTYGCYLTKTRNYGYDRYIPLTTVLRRRALTPIDGLKGYVACEVPNQLQGYESVKGPITLDYELATKVYESFKPDKIDNSRDQIWITLTNYYYHEDLGCLIAVLCLNPRRTPITAD